MDILPRFVEFKNDNYSYSSKIIVNEPLTDKLLLHNVFKGNIISSTIYPLIYDIYDESSPAKYRSLEFYRNVITNNDLYKNLDIVDKITFAIGIRDLFLASQRNMLTKDEIKLVKKLVNIVDDDIISANITGVNSSPYPSGSRKMIRFIDVNWNTYEQYFIKNELGLYIIFVDPADLSYHNFENILHLNIVNPHFVLSNMFKYEHHDIYKFSLIGSTDELLRLDEENLYAIPFNKSVRGGQRFIFNSSSIGQALTEAIEKSTFNQNNFVFVNNVFRYNKFAPGDGKFISHYDTPYYDADKGHCSKYTLLIYLTPLRSSLVPRAVRSRLANVEDR